MNKKHNLNKLSIIFVRNEDNHKLSCKKDDCRKHTHTELKLNLRNIHQHQHQSLIIIIWVTAVLHAIL